MIVDFSVGNYKSIKDIQTLSMSAAPIVSNPKYEDVDKNNVFKVNDKLSLLKSKAVYGANASGKSNLVRALITFISIVSDSYKDERILDKLIEPFMLSTDTENKPSYFQLSFIIKGVYYRYGFEVTDKEIVSEWLFGIPNKKEVPFFTREGMVIKVYKNQFEEGNSVSGIGKKNSHGITRINSLFLTVVNLSNGEISKKIIDYIRNIIIITTDKNELLFSEAYRSLNDKKTKEKIFSFLNIADTGIIDINLTELSWNNLPKNASPNALEAIDKGEKMWLVNTKQKKFNSKNKEVGSTSLEFTTHQSGGTIKMFGLSHFIIQALEENRPLIIDEYDSKFHPLLSKKLVELFNSDINKGQSQFIFITHDTNLLSPKLLRRDQICFVEKDKYGASHVYTLVDFKGVRNDASFEKDYISGRYGAIPFLGDFDSIFEK